MNARRLTALSGALVAGLLLTACGSPSGSSTDDASDATPSPEPTAAAAPTWDETPCGRIDPTAIAKIFDAETASEGGVGSQGSLPVRDTCTFDVGSADARSPVTIGWSVEPVDAAGFDDLDAYYEKVQGQYVDIVDLDDVGDGAFVVFRTAYARTGDRVVTVGFQGEGRPDPGVFRDALLAVLPAADELPPAQPVRTVPACEELDERAATALGSEPTIGRGGDDPLTCTWATSTASITLGSAELEDPAAEVDLLVQSGGEELDGLGSSAAWSDTPDGSVLRWATGNRAVTLQGATGQRLEKADAVALAEAAAPAYE